MLWPSLHGTSLEVKVVGVSAISSWSRYWADGLFGRSLVAMRWRYSYVLACTQSCLVPLQSEAFWACRKLGLIYLRPPVV